MLPLLPRLNSSDPEFSSGCSGAALDVVDHRKHAMSVPDEASFGMPARTPPDAGTVSSIPPPPPVPPSLASLTPYEEHPPDLATVEFQHNLDLPPTSAISTSSIPKSMRNLRLPSFDALGIASPLPSVYPHSKDLGDSVASASLPTQAEDLSHIRTASSSWPPATPQHALNDASPLPHGLDRLLPGYRAVQNLINTLTPPDDSGSLNWAASNAKTAAGANSSHLSSSQEGSSVPDGGTSASDRGTNLGMASQTALILNAGRAPWLRDALGVILDIVHLHNRSEAIKILSHALPSPSANGHVFPVVIEAIQQSTRSSSIMWMNVWHAVSGRFKWEDIPKSPPTTPAPPMEGDDYFTQRVFDYAVEVPDYSVKLAAQPLSPSLRSQQRPAIAPSSIDISIVERYIPPTSTAEFEGLFSVNGRSFLSDRLIELTPSHGTLLFIYPTRAGAKTFKRHYLDPLLDPILRSMMVSQSLPVTLIEDIGAMAAIRHLPYFDDMESQLKTFLNTLNNSGASLHSRFHRQNADYTLMYAKAQEVHLERAVWAQDWWNKQEKLRIQRAFETHDMHRQTGAFQASVQLATAERETQQAAQHNQAKLIQRAQTQSLLRNAEQTRGERQPGDNEQLILHLLQQIATKEYRDGPPTQGIEVGVFVIQKSFRTNTSGLMNDA